MIKLESKYLFYFYIAVSAFAFIFTFYHMPAYMNDGIMEVVPKFLTDVLIDSSSTKAILTVDLFFLSLPLIAWMLVEGRRVGIKHYWIFIYAGIFVLTSAAVPLFLAARERKLSFVDNRWSVIDIHKIELVIVGGLGACIFGVGVWFSLTL